MQNSQLVKQAPERTTFTQHNGMIRFINSDPLLVLTTRLLGLYPRTIFNLVRKSNIERVRMVCAMILDLWENGHYIVDYQGNYIDGPGALERQKTLARNAIVSIINNRKPIYLMYCGQRFYEHFPQYRGKSKEEQIR